MTPMQWIALLVILVLVANNRAHIEWLKANGPQWEADKQAKLNATTLLTAYILRWSQTAALLQKAKVDEIEIESLWNEALELSTNGKAFSPERVARLWVRTLQEVETAVLDADDPQLADDLGSKLWETAANNRRST